MGSVLFAWLGKKDLDAADAGRTRIDAIGPLARAVIERPFDEIYILSDWDKSTTQRYVKWLEMLQRHIPRITVGYEKLSGPMCYAEVYEASLRHVRSFVRKCTERNGNPPEIVYHLSPGSPAMQAVWLIIGKTRCPGAMIISSKEHGIEEVAFPFDIVADYWSQNTELLDDEIALLAQGLPPGAPEFDDIVAHCPAMKQAVARSRILAESDVPVLILGETGTGKEVVARAIYNASKRKKRGGEFVALNCGALPETLLESELFGHVRGAFTGAARDSRGAIARANGGVLFLDEFGELTPSAQTKLLRAIQDGMIVPVGGEKEFKVDFRIIAATNRDLVRDIDKGQFRSDLFWRVCVGLIHLPPLRERNEADIQALIDQIMAGLNQSAQKNGHGQKELTAGAINVLRRHSWPGNVRELQNTLTRAALFSPRQNISADDIGRAIIAMEAPRDSILHRPLGKGFDIQAVVGEVMKHYLGRAGEETGWNKSEMWKLLKPDENKDGYKTVTRWMAKHEVDKSGINVALPHGSE